MFFPVTVAGRNYRSHLFDHSHLMLHYQHYITWWNTFRSMLRNSMVIFYLSVTIMSFLLVLFVSCIVLIMFSFILLIDSEFWCAVPLGYSVNSLMIEVKDAVTSLCSNFKVKCRESLSGSMWIWTQTGGTSTFLVCTWWLSGGCDQNQGGDWKMTCLTCGRGQCACLSEFFPATVV